MYGLSRRQLQSAINISYLGDISLKRQLINHAPITTAVIYCYTISAKQNYNWFELTIALRSGDRACEKLAADIHR